LFLTKSRTTFTFAFFFLRLLVCGRSLMALLTNSMPLLSGWIKSHYTSTKLHGVTTFFRDTTIRILDLRVVEVYCSFMPRHRNTRVSNLDQVLLSSVLVILLFFPLIFSFSWTAQNSLTSCFCPYDLVIYKKKWISSQGTHSFTLYRISPETIFLKCVGTQPLYKHMFE
jgi:hypothetical protein